MYGTLSRHIENKLQGQATEKYLPELGKGKVVETGGGVCSGKLPLDSKADFYIAGNFDHLAELSDGTYAVIVTGADASGNANTSSVQFDVEAGVTGGDSSDDDGTTDSNQDDDDKKDDSNSGISSTAVQIGVLLVILLLLISFIRVNRNDRSEDDKWS